MVIVIVVVVAAAAILAGLWALGVGPFSSSNTSSGGGGGGGGGGTGETYSAAAQTASSAVSASPPAGGPWTLTGGEGVNIPSTLSVNQSVLNQSTQGGLCGTKILPGASSIASLPATTAGPSSGDSDAWIILFVNATYGTLEVAVFGGTATPLLTTTDFGGCAAPATSVSLPSKVVDSPVAATVAYNDGGSTWVSSWPKYDMIEILTPSVLTSHTQIPSYWVITYTTCNMGTDNGQTFGSEAPSQFTAFVYPTNGTLYRTLNESSACPSASSGGGGGGGGGGKPTLSSVCFGGFFEYNNTIDYYNNGTISCAEITTMTDGDLTVSIVNSTTGTPVTTTGFTLEIQNTSTMAVLSTYDFSTKTWSSPSLSVFGPKDTLNWFVLLTPQTMQGDSIVLTATSSAPATGSLTLTLGSA